MIKKTWKEKKKKQGSMIFFFFYPLESTANIQIHFGIRSIKSGGKDLFKTNEAVVLYQKTLPNDKAVPGPLPKPSFKQT